MGKKKKGFLPFKKIQQEVKCINFCFLGESRTQDGVQEARKVGNKVWIFKKGAVKFFQIFKLVEELKVFSETGIDFPYSSFDVFLFLLVSFLFFIGDILGGKSRKDDNIKQFLFVFL